MTNDEGQGGGSLLALAALALVAGALAGLVGAIFRLSLGAADRLRDALIAWAHGGGAIGFLFVVAACASATALAAWLVLRFSPQAAGSGIPHVEAVLRADLPPAPFRLIPVKFLAGLLAIGAGLALGREGPSVQMGASSRSSRGEGVPANLAGLPCVDCGGSRRRPRNGLQRANRGRRLCP